MMKKTFWMGALGLFLLSSCHNHDAHDGHDHEIEQHDHDAEGPGHNHDHEAEGASAHSDEIILSPEKAKAAGVETGIVQPGTFHQVIRTSGSITAAQGEERVAVATVSGVVSFHGKVTEGMKVSQGSPLVLLSSRHMAEGDPVQKARVAYETARKEYERMKALVGDKIVSEKAFAQAEQAYENARISYEAVAKGQTAQGQAVPAPIDGYVKSLLVQEGDYVQVGQPLVSIARSKRLSLRADVSEKYYPRLAEITSAHFCTPYNDRVYKLEEMNGRLLSYGKATNDQSFYIPVTFEFDNVQGVVPGAFVEVYLLTAVRDNVLTLPRTAITEEQGSYFVYLQVDEHGYRKQLVTLGGDGGERVQITSGLQGGERVVTKGAYQVKLASASNAIPAHTHEH